jgi:pilus assembly protein CpaD
MKSLSFRTAVTISALPAILAACAPDRVVTGTVYPYDYRERHPIVITHAPEHLDLFVSGRGLDRRQREDLAGFITEYRGKGQGPITVAVPQGPRSAGASQGASSIRSVLANAGVSVASTTYPVADPTLAAPVRLSFSALAAKVASHCGLWPQDLGVSDAGFNNNNKPYYNLGCAMQSNIAAQVADPADLVGGRAEGRPDTIRRMGNLEKLRRGQDPATNYREAGGSIGAVGN